jgi:hypothetical protein
VRILRRALYASVVTVALGGNVVAAAQEAPPSLEVVAQVGDVAIAKAEFDWWFVQAAHSQFGRPMELVPPGYERCVAAKGRQRAARGWRRLDEVELRARCGRDHRFVRRSVLQFLVQGQWIQQEAALRGVEVGARRVERLFKSQKRTAFPDERAYQRFLRKSGTNEVAIKYRIRLDALQTGLTRQLKRRVAPVTKRDVSRYRAAHPKAYRGMGRAKANRQIRRLLVSQRQQLMLAGFIDRFRKHYRAITWCAEGYAIAECGAIAPAPPAASPRPE